MSFPTEHDKVDAYIFRNGFTTGLKYAGPLGSQQLKKSARATATDRSPALRCNIALRCVPCVNAELGLPLLEWRSCVRVSEGW